MCTTTGILAFNVFGKVDGDQEGPNKQCEIERARQRSLKFAPRSEYSFVICDIIRELR